MQDSIQNNIRAIVKMLIYSLYISLIVPLFNLIMIIIFLISLIHKNNFDFRVVKISIIFGLALALPFFILFILNYKNLKQLEEKEDIDEIHNIAKYLRNKGKIPRILGTIIYLLIFLIITPFSHGFSIFLLPAVILIIYCMKYFISIYERKLMKYI